MRRLQSPDPDMETLLDQLRGTSIEQRATLVDWILTRPPEFAPGTDWTYSNGGYVVAALLAERASDLTFATLTRRELFEPLAMRSAYVGRDDHRTA